MLSIQGAPFHSFWMVYVCIAIHLGSIAVHMGLINLDFHLGTATILFFPGMKDNGTTRVGGLFLQMCLWVGKITLLK